MKLKVDNLSKKFLIIALLFFLAIFTINFVTAVGDGKFYPCDQDEAIIFSSADLFYQTSSVKAPSMISEASSKILEANWYGPFYHIFYGGLAKVFGFHNGLIIMYINLVLLILSIVLFYISFSKQENRLLGAFLFLISPVLMPYFFTFFPQTLSLFFSVVLLYFLIKINNDYENNKLYGQNFYLFLVLVFLFSLFKATYVFWIASLLPFFKTKKELGKNISIFFLFFLIIYLYMGLFTAPPYASNIKVIGLLKEFKIVEFITIFFKQITNNVIYFFSITMRDMTSFITFVLAVSVVIISFQKKQRFLIATSLIVILYYFILLSFYSPHYYYLTKQSMPVYPILIYTVSLYFQKNARLLVLIVFLLFLPYNINSSLNNIKARRVGYINFSETYKPLKDAFFELKNYVNQDKESVILWDYDEHGYPYSCTGVIMPCSNKNNDPIRYTTNIYWEKVADSLQFEFHNKLPVEFVLSKDSLVLKNLKLIHKTRFYHFYKRIHK